jgi:hypothetical protein
MVKRVKLGAVLLLFACLGTGTMLSSGCQKHITVTGLPPGVTQVQVTNWYAAEGALQQIAQTNSALRQAVIGVHGIPNTPLPDGKLYVGILQSVGKIDQAQVAAANFLNTVPNSWGTGTASQIGSWATGILDAINSMVTSGAVNVKNPNSQLQLSDLIATLKTAAQLLVTLSAGPTS